MEHSTLVTKTKDHVGRKISLPKGYIIVSISVTSQRQKRPASFKSKEIQNYDLSM